MATNNANSTGAGTIAAGTNNIDLSAAAVTGTIGWTLTGNATTMTGSGGNDTITGAAGINTINGGDGNDSLNGAGGADTINGGSNNDRITGGAGADNLSGDGDADTFVYTTVTDSAPGSMDRIFSMILSDGNADTLDFNLTGTVTVRTANVGAAIATITDATSVNVLFNSTNGTESAGERFTGGTNATGILATFNDGTLLVVDVNGDGNFTVADSIIDVTGVFNFGFTAAIFV